MEKLNLDLTELPAVGEANYDTLLDEFNAWNNGRIIDGELTAEYLQHLNQRGLTGAERKERWDALRQALITAYHPRVQALADEESRSVALQKLMKVADPEATLSRNRIKKALDLALGLAGLCALVLAGYARYFVWPGTNPADLETQSTLVLYAVLVFLLGTAGPVGALLFLFRMAKVRAGKMGEHFGQHKFALLSFVASAVAIYIAIQLLRSLP